MDTSAHKHRSRLGASTFLISASDSTTTLALLPLPMYVVHLCLKRVILPSAEPCVGVKTCHVTTDGIEVHPCLKLVEAVLLEEEASVVASAKDCGSDCCLAAWHWRGHPRKERCHRPVCHWASMPLRRRGTAPRLGASLLPMLVCSL